LAKSDNARMTRRDLCRSKPGGSSKCDDIASVVQDLEKAGLVLTFGKEKPGGQESVLIELTKLGWEEVNAL